MDVSDYVVDPIEIEEIVGNGRGRRDLMHRYVKSPVPIPLHPH